MNWKRVIVIISVSPILVIPVFFVGLALLMVFGVEYALTGKFNQDEGGW